MLPAAIPFPDLSPEIFTIEIGGFAFALRWYALAYIIGILIGWRLALRALRTARLWPGGQAPMTPGELDDLLTWIIVGIIVGGRLGFVLFYQPAYYFANPLEIPMVWQGGMSFHGGIIGVAVAGLIFCLRNGRDVASVADLFSLATPPGLLLGRVANFINAELWGRPTDMPWGVIFPGPLAQDCPGVTGPCARHPSQLYEAGLEGLLLFAVLLWLAWGLGWLQRPGQIAGVFIGGYGAARVFVEAFRQADPQFITPENPLGHVIRFGEAGLTMGQILSLPMLVLGIAILVWARTRRP